MVRKAVCLLSGGIDSCVSAYIAKEEGYKIYALSFYYNQKHYKEIKSAKNIAKSLKTEEHIVFNIDLKDFFSSALVNKSLKIPNTTDIKNIGKSIPITYVPARNTIFLSIALAYAEILEAEAIYIGVTSTDYSGYPDCRPEFIESFQKMANLATKKGVEGFNIKIKTPLIYLTKSEIITLGNKLKVKYENTWSCYVGEDKPCGKCESCLLRLKGFKHSGIKDPLNYENLPNWYS